MDSLVGASGLSAAELTTAFWTALAVSNRGPDGAPISSDDKLNYRPISAIPSPAASAAAASSASSRHALSGRPPRRSAPPTAGCWRAARSF